MLGASLLLLLGAAVADDVMGLVILTVVTRIAAEAVTRPRLKTAAEVMASLIPALSLSPCR